VKHLLALALAVCVLLPARTARGQDIVFLAGVVGLTIPLGLAIADAVVTGVNGARAVPSQGLARAEIGLGVTAALLGIGGCGYAMADHNFITNSTLGPVFLSIAVIDLVVGVASIAHGAWVRTRPPPVALAPWFQTDRFRTSGGLQLAGHF
jgi:hypothetical protein